MLIPENSMSTACIDFSSTFLVQQSCTFGNSSLEPPAINILAFMLEKKEDEAISCKFKLQCTYYVGPATKITEHEECQLKEDSSTCKVKLGRPTFFHFFVVVYYRQSWQLVSHMKTEGSLTWIIISSLARMTHGLCPCSLIGIHSLHTLN